MCGEASRVHGLTPQPAAARKRCGGGERSPTKEQSGPPREPPPVSQRTDDVDRQRGTSRQVEASVGVTERPHARVCPPLRGRTPPCLRPFTPLGPLTFSRLAGSSRVASFTNCSHVFFTSSGGGSFPPKRVAKRDMVGRVPTTSPTAPRRGYKWEVKFIAPSPSLDGRDRGGGKTEEPDRAGDRGRSPQAWGGCRRPCSSLGDSQGTTGGCRLPHGLTLHRRTKNWK